MKEHACTGFWCLPEQPDDLVAGTLHVSDSGNLRLSLIGTLGAREDGERGKAHRIIVGSVDESPRGNAVTLLNCTLMGSSIGSYHGGREEYQAARAFFGDDLSGADPLQFRCVLLKLGGLSEWAESLSGLRNGETKLPTSRDAGKLVPALSYLMPVFPSGRIPGAEITLNLGVSTQSRAQTFKLREDANIFVKFDQPKSLAEIDGGYVYPLQNLMTFATDRPQRLESLSVWRGDDLADWQGNPEIRAVGPRMHPRDESGRSVRSHEMLLTLADVEFAPFVEKWLRLAGRYADVFNIYFGIQYGPPAYIDMTYALAAQSVALYYARSDAGVEHRAKEEERLKRVVRLLPGSDAEWILDHLGVNPPPSFRSVLQKLTERHGSVLDPLLAHRRDAFVNQAATTLRYIGTRDREDGSAAGRGSELYWLTQKLRFLLRACFLAELDFGQEQIAEMVNRNPYYQHIANLETVKAGSQPAGKEIDISFQFIIPTDSVLEAARRMAASSIPDEQAVGRSVLKLTEVTTRTKAAVEDAASQKDYDLSVYFDFDLSDSLGAAQRLLESAGKEAKNVAQTLQSQADAIAASKTAFLKATK
jgi:hypothetical protein